MTGAGIPYEQNIRLQIFISNNYLIKIYSDNKIVQDVYCKTVKTIVTILAKTVA